MRAWQHSAPTNQGMAMFETYMLLSIAGIAALLIGFVLDETAWQ